MAGHSERAEWAGRNLEEDERQGRVEQALKNEAKRIRFFGAQPEPGLQNPYVGVVRPDRPGEHFMEALDIGRVLPVERSLPGLGPTGAELAAQRHIDAAQARQMPEQREDDRTPLVGRPERMSDEANARLFPMGPSNDPVLPTREERAVAAVSWLGAQMRLDAERTADASGRSHPDDNER